MWIFRKGKTVFLNKHLIVFSMYFWYQNQYYSWLHSCYIYIVRPPKINLVFLFVHTVVCQLKYFYFSENGKQFVILPFSQKTDASCAWKSIFTLKIVIIREWLTKETQWYDTVLFVHVVLIQIDVRTKGYFRTYFFSRITLKCFDFSFPIRHTISKRYIFQCNLLSSVQFYEGNLLYRKGQNKCIAILVSLRMSLIIYGH